MLAAQGQGGLFDAPAAANQEPIKNETRTNAGPAPAERDSDQEPIKNPAPAVGNAPSPLEALFSDLNSDSTRKANKAKKAAAKLPEAARIEYVQANFHDILMQMMEAGALEVNGFATLAAGGFPAPPILVTRVRDRQGKVLEETKPLRAPADEDPHDERDEQQAETPRHGTAQDVGFLTHQTDGGRSDRQVLRADHLADHTTGGVGGDEQMLINADIGRSGLLQGGEQRICRRIGAGDRGADPTQDR